MVSARPFAVALALIASAAPLTGAGQGYPSKAVRMVVPFPAGGSTDIVGRTVAQKLSELWGHQVRPRQGRMKATLSDIVAHTISRKFLGC